MTTGLKPVAAMVFAALLAAQAAIAFTSYTPAWTARPTPLGYTVDYSQSVAADDTYVYVASVLEESGRQTNSSLDAYNPDGTHANAAIYYSTAGDDVIVNEVNAELDMLALVGALSGGWGTAAFIAKAFKSNLSIDSTHVLNLTSRGDRTVYYGVCAASGGYYYAVGRLVNATSHHHALVSAYAPTLDLANSVSISLQSFNLTAYSCIVGPDGYVYISGLVLWYYNGVNYPAYLAVYKLDPGTLDVAASKYVPLYTSAGYVTRAAYTPTGTATDGSKVYIAFTYADERPDPTNPSSGGAVIALDTNMNIVGRVNISTDYDDALVSVEAGSLGDFAAAGWTYSDFGTGLGTQYPHSLLLVFDSDWTLRRAVLAGSGDGSTYTLQVTASPSGNIYTAGAAYSDSVYFYDVTSEASQALTSPPRGVEAAAAGAPAGKGGRPWAKFTGHHPGAPSTTPIEATGAAEPGYLLTARPRAQAPPNAPGLLETGSGASSGIIVAYQDTISSPPPPIPEPGLLAALSALAGAGAAAALARARARRHAK